MPPLGTKKEKIEALALCFSENSSLNYNTSHQGLYEHVCGVKPLWNPFLEEQGIPLNSIRAGYSVYQYYLDQTNSNTKALKNFKGIASQENMWIINKVQRVMYEVKQKHLKDIK